MEKTDKTVFMKEGPVKISHREGETIREREREGERSVCASGVKSDM